MKKTYEFHIKSQKLRPTSFSFKTIGRDFKKIRTLRNIFWGHKIPAVTIYIDANLIKNFPHNIGAMGRR